VKNLISAVFILLVCAFATVGSAAGATEHCPDHNRHPGKVEGGNLNDIVLEAGTNFCVKGSTEATGILVADGVTTLFDYLNNGHDVSYYVVYETQPTPTSTLNTPTPNVTPTPTPEVTPTPRSTPIVSGSPVPTSTPSEVPITPELTLPPTDT
jgi:hypothetical protein